MSGSHEWCSGCASTGGIFSQTVDELDFERSLCGAASSNDIARAIKLLERSEGKRRNTVNECDQYGYSPLHYACRNGNLEMVELMLKHGAEVNKLTKSTRATPLHRACYAGQNQIVRLLLSTHSCDVSLQDVDGETALMKCWKQQQWPCFRVFVDYSLTNVETRGSHETNTSSTRPSIKEVSQEVIRCFDASSSSFERQLPTDIIASVERVRENLVQVDHCP